MIREVCVCNLGTHNNILIIPLWYYRGAVYSTEQPDHGCIHVYKSVLP